MNFKVVSYRTEEMDILAGALPQLIADLDGPSIIKAFNQAANYSAGRFAIMDGDTHHFGDKARGSEGGLHGFNNEINGVANLFICFQIVADNLKTDAEKKVLLPIIVAKYMTHVLLGMKSYYAGEGRHRAAIYSLLAMSNILGSTEEARKLVNDAKITPDYLKDSLNLMLDDYEAVEKVDPNVNRDVRLVALNVAAQHFYRANTASKERIYYPIMKMCEPSQVDGRTVHNLAYEDDKSYTDDITRLQSLYRQIDESRSGKP